MGELTKEQWCLPALFFLLERAILPLALAAFTPKLVYSLLPAMSLMFYELLPLH